MSDSTARLLRGFLEPCLLALLEGGADYGLSLARRLSAAGLREIPGGGRGARSRRAASARPDRASAPGPSGGSRGRPA